MAEAKVRKPRKVKGIKQDGSPNAAWRKFQSRLALYSDTPFEEWNEYYFLGHILKRYKDYMGCEYPFTYRGAPSTCQEMYCVKRMITTLTTSDGNIIKDYIDFVFDKHIIPRKVSITSLAYFFTMDLIFEFKKICKKNSIVSRSTKLPTNYQDIINNLKLDVCTYGDLAFAKIALDNDPKNTDLAIYAQMFKELNGAGFDSRVLEKLDGN